MDIFEKMQKDFDEFYAKGQEFIKSQKIRNKELELLRKQNDLLQEENLDYRYDITDIACEKATEMAQGWEEQYKYEIAELKEKLKNKPKFNVGDKVYLINDDKEVENDFIESIEIDDAGIEYYTIMYGICWYENELFSTKEEAEAKLKEIMKSE